MQPKYYALVAYVHNALGDFVEGLRSELHPPHSHLPAHITVLPPRPLSGSEAQAIELVEQVCAEVRPFEVVMGGVENFMPKTPTVFIRVAHAAYRMRELHDHLNIDGLRYEEPWPYMPHLTIVKVETNEAAEAAAEIARQRWAAYAGSKRILIEELTFVRQGERVDEWIDVAPVPLGRRLAPTP